MEEDLKEEKWYPIEDNIFHHYYNLFYRINEDGETATIGVEHYEDERFVTTIHCPQFVDGYLVTNLEEDTFTHTEWYHRYHDRLVYAGDIAYKFKGKENKEVSIAIKEGCVGIADKIFSHCSGLTSVVIPNSVIYIGNYAFEYCSGLTSVNIPNSVKTIGDSAFCSCNKLTTVVIGNSVKTIGDSAFSYCDSLTSIIIPDSVIKIGDSAFYYCDDLSSVVIGKSVKEIGYNSFKGCISLHSIFCKTANPTSHFEMPNDETILYIPIGSLDAYIAIGFEENQLVELTDEEMKRRIAELKGQQI
ncbi:MAG: leucine-rich repeat domain-containing protein [Muribaculaceae bacterium]|nr:leucine-rich repeat domain-containing protein [Muribaculaceae bacterium]